MKLKKGIITILLNLFVVTVAFNQSYQDLNKVAESGDNAEKLEVIKESWKSVKDHNPERDGYSLGMGATQSMMFTLLEELIEQDYKPAIEFVKENEYEFEAYLASIPSFEDHANDAMDEMKSWKTYTKKLTKATFIEKVWDYTGEHQPEWKYKGDKPALIEFYADWCAPCKKAAPIIEELAKEYNGQLDIYKIDADVEKELVAVFGIKSIPTFFHIPLEGMPTLSAGIGKNKEESKKLLNEYIDKLMLSNN